MDLKDQIKELAHGLQSQLVQWRRHLHANPELSFEEHQTMAFIAATLKSLGVEFEEGVAGTGVVASIRGVNPESRTVALESGGGGSTRCTFSQMHVNNMGRICGGDASVSGTWRSRHFI